MDTIAQRIVEGLRVRLSPAEQVGIAKAATQNPVARAVSAPAICLRVSSSALSRDDCDSAIEHFDRAIQLDPNLRWPMTNGACYVNRVFKGFGARDYERAEVAFKKHSQSIPTSSKHAC